jgi:DNA-damage-inducible protein J
MIHARVEPKLKKSVERIFSDLGISTTEAIRLFLKQVVLHRGLPFPVAMPNAETLEAMREAESPATLQRIGSFRELRRQL